MGQFLDSAAFANASAGVTQTPTDGRKTTVATTSGGTSPVANLAVSSVMSALSSGGTRVYLSVDILMFLSYISFYCYLLYYCFLVRYSTCFMRYA